MLFPSSEPAASGARLPSKLRVPVQKQLLPERELPGWPERAEWEAWEPLPLSEASEAKKAGWAAWELLPPEEPEAWAARREEPEASEAKKVGAGVSEQILPEERVVPEESARNRVSPNREASAVRAACHPAGEEASGVPALRVYSPVQGGG